jgi:predicted DCC family thiol-disulfide oxidoreductase YuxK
MASFHVRDGQGRLHQGAAAFVVLWSHLPGYRWLAVLVRSMHLTGPLQAVYRRWAAWRLRRRCRDGQCRVRHD